MVGRIAWQLVGAARLLLKADELDADMERQMWNDWMEPWNWNEPLAEVVNIDLRMIEHLKK